jgi:hypothetical protein
MEKDKRNEWVSVSDCLLITTRFRDWFVDGEVHIWREWDSSALHCLGRLLIHCQMSGTKPEAMVSLDGLYDHLCPINKQIKPRDKLETASTRRKSNY